jgi:hypothetical protein
MYRWKAATYKRLQNTTKRQPPETESARSQKRAARANDCELTNSQQELQHQA